MSQRHEKFLYATSTELRTAERREARNSNAVPRNHRAFSHLKLRNLLIARVGVLVRMTTPCFGEPLVIMWRRVWEEDRVMERPIRAPAQTSRATK
jgi:hypothetical protein